MKNSTRRVIVPLIGALALSVTFSGVTSAQETFPTKRIQYVLHATPGGGTDVMARTLAPAVEEALGQTVVVENRPGGGGAVQMTFLTRSAQPDGHTIGAVTGTHVGRMNSALKGTFSVDSFDWVSGLLTEPMIFVVHNDSPIQTLAEMIAAIEATPNTLKVASFAIGSAQHIAWHILADGAKFDADKAIWVPYDSIGDAATATLGKHADICVCFVTQVRDHVRAGNMRILAVLADERPGPFPEVPTVAEAGYPDVETGWVQFRGIMAPKGLPEDRKQVIHEAFMTALKSERVANWMDANALQPMGYGPERFEQFVRRYDELAATWLKRLGVAQ